MPNDVNGSTVNGYGATNNATNGAVSGNGALNGTSNANGRSNVTTAGSRGESLNTLNGSGNGSQGNGVNGNALNGNALNGNALNGNALNGNALNGNALNGKTNDGNTNGVQSSSAGDNHVVVSVADEQTPLITPAAPAPQPQQNQQEQGQGQKAEEEEESSAEWREKYRQLFYYAMKHAFPSSFFGKMCAVIAVLLRAVNSGCSIIRPLTLKLAIDSLSVPNPDHRLPFLYISAYVGLALISNAISKTRSLVWSRVTMEQSRKLTVASFAHTHNLSLGQLYKQKMGALVSMTSRGTRAVMSLMRTGLFEILPTLIETAVVTTVLIKFKSPEIAAVIFGSVIIYIGLTFFFTPRLLKFRKAENEAHMKVFHKKWDSLSNVETVKYFGAEEREAKEYEGLLDASNDIELQNRGFRFWSDEAKYCVSEFGSFVCLCISVNSVINGKMSAGSLVAINSYYFQLFSPLTSISYIYTKVLGNFTDLEKFVDFIYTKAEIQDAPNAYKLPIEAKADETPMVRFENVTFSYSKKGVTKTAVKNMSFELARGKRLALVGPSGAGKSTVIKLLLRLFDVDSGRVLINGHDVKNVTIDSLRDQLGIVAQDTVLFNDTIRFNIAYGKPDATDAEVYAAARAAALGDFIARLDEGLDTLCGERGVRLSGGEKQRVGLARCLIKNPQVIILDESTSNLDTMTEREIQKNLAMISKTRTMVAIAHRLSTIMSADEIIVIHEGEIAEKGSHKELLNAGPSGIYKQLWSAQAGSFIGDIKIPDTKQKETAKGNKEDNEEEKGGNPLDGKMDTGGTQTNTEKKNSLKENPDSTKKES